MRPERPVHRRLALLWALTLSTGVTTSGCSLIFVRGPPNEPPSGGQAVKCTQSRVAPAFDAIFTSVEVLRLGIDAVASDSTFSSTSSGRGGDIALGVLFGGLFLGSAIYGFHATDRCDDAVRGVFPQSSSRGGEKSSEGTKQKSTGDARPADSATPPAGPNRFDVTAARVALAATLRRAAQVCSADGGMRGQGTVTLTYQPDGRITDVMFTPRSSDTAFDACVTRTMGEASVGPFEGEPVAARKHFDFGDPSMATVQAAPDAGP